MMDPKNPCQGFCCSRWIEQQQSNIHLINHPSPLQNSDLSFPIHQILSFDQFSGISRNNYHSVLALPVRLVSRFFTLDAFAKYIVIMCEGDVHLTEHREGRLRKGRKVDVSEVGQKTAVSRYPKPEHRSGVRKLRSHPKHKATLKNLRSRAQRIMAKLANMVEFEIADTGGSYGRAIPIEGPLPLNYNPMFASGCRTKIRLSSKLVNDLTASRTTNPGNYRRNGFHLAKTILHELSHALGYAVDGLRFPEAYYKNEPYAERGAQMEQQVFGGMLREQIFRFTTCGNSIYDAEGRLPYRTQRFVVLEKWPSAVTAYEYETNRLPLGSRKKAEPYAEVSLVSEEFIARLFTNRFWEVDVPRFGHGPIRSSGQAWWISKLHGSGKETLRVMCNAIGEHTLKYRRRLLDAGRRQSVGTAEDWVDSLEGGCQIFSQL
ncbi:hypothetical protein PRZ48_008798 [Zasmidium cellare]|uniref:Uncharacterized protein n=1 Tax=Zasmidium cellare TaxID=395010 RepID=A0ABR0EGV9_ZASCE|nr:hypothetical protein PRZ48_008798 [Zasmidium cellare]